MPCWSIAGSLFISLCSECGREAWQVVSTQVMGLEQADAGGPGGGALSSPLTLPLPALALSQPSAAVADSTTAVSYD